mmetsp:Transcript_22691/g.55410  ORF Transcript_22691/g.55410 Transcript_22691/m.55410 type:complete len:243 (-) Transcript_22691:1225-1953(-)
MQAMCVLARVAIHIGKGVDFDDDGAQRAVAHVAKEHVVDAEKLSGAVTLALVTRGGEHVVCGATQRHVGRLRHALGEHTAKALAIDALLVGEYCDAFGPVQPRDGARHSVAAVAAAGVVGAAHAAVERFECGRDHEEALVVKQRTHAHAVEREHGIATNRVAPVLEQAHGTHGGNVLLHNGLTAFERAVGAFSKQLERVIQHGVDATHDVHTAFAIGHHVLGEEHDVVCGGGRMALVAAAAS